MAKKILLLIILIIVVLLGSNLYNKYMNKITPVEMTIEDSMDADKVKEAVNDNSSTKISKEQATQVSQQIKNIVTNNKKPTTTVVTTGENYKTESTKYATDKKADAVILTPSTENDKQTSEIKEGDIVNLNQYNVYAYPKHMVGATIYTDGTKELEYSTRIKVFNQNAYIGPAVKLDNNNNVAIGVKLTIPFN